jgi:hypothetical protein
VRACVTTDSMRSPHPEEVEPVALSLMDLPPLTPRELRPLLGRPVQVQTVTTTMRGLLLSCVQRSVWIVVDDDSDVVVRLDEVVSVRPD